MTMTKPTKTAQNNAKTAKRGRPFLPGQSGNPGGRPRTRELAKVIREFLAEKLRGKGGKTRLDALIKRLYSKDPRTLLAYGYGKPVESHLLAGEFTHAAPDPKREKPPFDFEEFARLQNSLFGMAQDAAPVPQAGAKDANGET